MSKKITEIIIETEQVVVRRSPPRLVEAWCDGCADFVRMVTVDEAARLTHISARAIFRQVETGELHFTETPDGRLLICLESLRNGN